MTGDISVETWQKRVTQKETIARNRFGGDVQIATSDMGRQAAADFNENF